MAKLTEIVAYLDELLEPASFSDYGPNGLQVPGREDVGTIVTGVSAGAELFERAIERGRRRDPRPPRPVLEGRPAGARPARRAPPQLLLERDVSLLAYHLPLDGHQEHGNNALLAAALGCEAWRPFPAGESPAIGVAGTFGEDGVDAGDLIERAQAAIGGRAPLAFPDGPDACARSASSPAAPRPTSRAAIDEGLDAFLTGEPVERVMLQAREAGIHFLAAGHYATETLGVRRLGELLAERFGVAPRFVDVPNPI